MRAEEEGLVRSEVEGRSATSIAQSSSDKEKVSMSDTTFFLIEKSDEERDALFSLCLSLSLSLSLPLFLA